MTERNDLLVADYLSRVSRATAGLPPEQRDELLRDLQEHIDSGRAELTVETEARVREILDRLGEPWVSARAAAEDAAPMPYAPPPYAPMPYTPTPEPNTRSKQRSHWLLIIAIAVVVVLLALCAGVFFFRTTGPDPIPEGPQLSPHATGQARR